MFYVQLSSAVAAILSIGQNNRTQFWMNTTQVSFQQSLIKIRVIVKENRPRTSGCLLMCHDTTAPRKTRQETLVFCRCIM